ncbi:MAG: DNA gyrase subunit A [Oscillospiraceae bacterium]|nr:DNA gyrase subunit A [Oscillospiraceae bacterium]
MEAIENQKIINVELNNEMKQSYIEYAMSVIVSRALPDVRDGLKPVHRRILYDMYESNLLYESDFRKSATTVGSVLGHFHPHGDSSVYDAMVRMAQDWSLRYPLVLGKGNFGSIDGDPPAAYRYTEAKMTKLSALMLEDIEKDTVKFIPNYDDKQTEPDVLPSRFPQLLVNGSSGIAVGMATNIPPHNLGEVVDGIIAVIDDPELTIEELMHYIKGPDFPTAGIILGQAGIRSAYTTGRGRIIMRARTEIEEMANHSRIIITELPYQVNKARLHEKIAELVRDGKIDGISGLRDESDKDGIRFVIELKRDANANIVLNNLYKYTQMQETFGAIMLALVGNDQKQPKILNLREMIDYYIAHQEEVITRRTRFELKKAEEHAHLLEGYRTAIDNITEIVEIIRSSKNIPESKERLTERFDLDDIQSTAIVEMRLGRLTGMERDKIDEDYRKTTENIEDYKDILANRQRVLDIIKTDLTEIKAKYGDERRSEISFDVNEIDIEDLIDEEEIIITLTHMGYVKRMPVTTYRSQRRGGRGISGVTTKEEDFVEQLITTSTHNTMLFFTTKGMVYKLKGYQLPEAGRQAKGSAIVNLLPLESDEKISATIAVADFEDGKYLTFITKKGMIKKTDLMDYSKIRNGGLRAIELNEGDELIKVSITDDTKDIIVGTHEGMAIRFKETDVRPTGRITRGVRAVRLNENDYVVGASIAEENSTLLVVTENGYGKKTDLGEYRMQSRGGKGIFTYKITDKTGCVAGMNTVTDNDDIMMITSEGIVIRLSTEDISTFGRQTQGVRLMKLDDNVKVVSIALAAKEEESEDDAGVDDTPELPPDDHGSTSDE